MIISLLIGTLAGFLLGIISGLVPGIHSNTIAGMLLSLQPMLLVYTGIEVAGAMMFAALVTHTFLDIVPSTFLGVPDADTAITVLPAHSLCLEGKGEEVVRISAAGSGFAVLFSLPLVVLALFLIPHLQNYLDWWMGLLLVAVAGFLIVASESPGWSAAVFLTSGLLGIIAFRYSYLSWNTFGAGSILLPLLTGLFGISVLLTSSRGFIVPQKFTGLSVGMPELAKRSIIGCTAGAIVGWLPGLSNATANAVLAGGRHYPGGKRGYIAATSAANTANAFFALAALYAVSRTRNGVMAALAANNLPDFSFILISGILAAVLAYILTIRISRLVVFMGNLDLRLLNFYVIVFVTLLCAVLTGPFGIFILILAVIIGLVPQMVNIRRVFCIGAVMVPVMLYYWGVILF